MDYHLHFHRICVHLAHVLSPVFSLHTSYVERPRVIVVMSHTQPRIVRDNMLVDGQDRLRICLYPSNLLPAAKKISETQKIYYNTCKFLYDKVSFIVRSEFCSSTSKRRF